MQPAGTDDGDLREGVSLPGMSAVSPRVIYDGWGFIEIEGLGRFRDSKLWPGGGRAWDWRETGTDHRPGILSADVTELLDHEPDLVILSRGRDGGPTPATQVHRGPKQPVLRRSNGQLAPSAAMPARIPRA